MSIKSRQVPKTPHSPTGYLDFYDAAWILLQVLDQPIVNLKGVGPALAAKLARINLHTVQDLLFHLPIRYEDRTRLTPISQLRVGVPSQIQGNVIDARLEPGKKRSLLVKLRDQEGEVGLRYYYYTAQLKSRFTPGRKIKAYGEPRLGRSGLEIYHPETELLDVTKPIEMETEYSPIYPVTEGVQQKRMRELCQQALQLMKRTPAHDWLPPGVLGELRLPELNEALTAIHHPPLDANLQALAEGRAPGQQRLAVEEMIAHHLSLLKLRHKLQQSKAAVLNQGREAVFNFIEGLPFALTKAQQRVIEEIRRDIETPVPMLRLVQGDVGSGKTVVACCAALHAVASGYQAALMAPTEILAEQHYRNLQQWLAFMDIRVQWLGGKMKTRERKQIQDEIRQGDAQVIIGTHALFQESVEFDRLGLVIIDEQHRFGVHQRLALRSKGERSGQVPHQLIMTATPIPRTLAMSAYADLDTSVIDELPPGRTPVTTAAIPDTRRVEVINRVEDIIRQNRQVYWVCTLIEESEVLQCQAAEATATELQEALPGVRVGLVHGRLKSPEKEQIMGAFKRGELDLLVATTVIEVGVDVANATLMVIENPERLGLAQLHQLRGRVGRGAQESFCLLLYHPPLSETAKARLQVLRESNDGFIIAEKDLEIRGPGEVLGTRQTGLIQFRIADLQRDQNWLPIVKRIAQRLSNDHLAAEGLIARWLGQCAEYGQV